MFFNISTGRFSVSLVLLGLFLNSPAALANDTLPIADAHVHYSHDSVELTPPERVIELMRSANLKFALVSSSDDNGTQLLSELAPDLIVPGLRPYRRRGELSTWFRDPLALAYVEELLERNRYATIGEFHLYGDTVELPIPRRIVELADQHNLVLHAHSDAEAVERILAQNRNVKVLWAHSGFDDPADIAMMLEKHDRLWGDLAFRSEVGSGGQLSQEWRDLFTRFPDRIMLGTDTYTPERMYFLPEHAEASRTWLSTLPTKIAENVAWKNAWNLLMPIWEKNNSSPQTMNSSCGQPLGANSSLIEKDGYSVVITPESKIAVSKPFSTEVNLCGNHGSDTQIKLDARMPAHGHGMNYKPEHSSISSTLEASTVTVDGLVLHMPGNWEWVVEIRADGERKVLTRDFTVQ
ncbi:MAG: amidohydrolase [Granulosicoccus sp.]|nr:amidohydrolase [Granulosicoccus sp.]